MRTHASRSSELKETGPHPGEKVLETENAFKEWVKKETGLFSGKHDNWYSSKIEVHSLSEFKEKSGMETSIF